MKKVLYYLNQKLFPLYKKLQSDVEKLELHKKELQKKKEEEIEDFENSAKEINVLILEQNKIKEDKEKTQNELKDKLDEINESIEVEKLKNELEELKKKNEYEELKKKFEKEEEVLKLELEGNINESKKASELSKDAQKKSNEIASIELKYKCLQNNVYNDKEFDELIKIAKQRQEEINNDEIDNLKEQKNELQEFEQQTQKRINNLREKCNLEIQKKFFELKNYKLVEYNKFLLEKRKLFNDFKDKFSTNQISNENLKKKEIEKAKVYFEQQRKNLEFRENIFKDQKQKIHSLVKQLEINNDEYSNNLAKELNI